MRLYIRGLLVLTTLLGALMPADMRAGSPGRLTGLIVYWSENPWPSIWAVRPDGSHDRRLLRNRQNAKRPRLSPDRAWVVFDGAPPGKAVMTDFDIQVVRVNGTGRQTLTSTDDWDIDAQWSPNGTQISFTRSRPRPQGCTGSSVWIMQRDGSDGRRVAAGCVARWSSGGTRLVYTSPDGRDLLVTDVTTGTTRRLLQTSAQVSAAGWSPDGGSILFTRTSDRFSDNGHVMVMKADGTGARTLGVGRAACWSPDGRKILYTSSFTSPLYLMNRDGSHKHRLMSIVAAEPDWR